MAVKTNSGRLPTLGSHHNYFTRNRDKYETQKHTLEFFNKKPSSAGIKFLYKIPREIQLINNLTSFKKNLKNYLIGKAIYSIKEFMDE